MNSETKDLSLQLYESIRAGNVDEVISIIGNGVDINKSAHCPIPLIAAAQDGQTQIVKSLLAVDGIEVNYHMPNGRTALHYAALLEDMMIMKLLLRAGADPAMKDCHGNTPCDLSPWSATRRYLTWLMVMTPQERDERLNPQKYAEPPSNRWIGKPLYAPVVAFNKELPS